MLRGWLAILRDRGAARTSLARRAAALRTFTAWAHRSQRAEIDAGALLASPRALRTLPAVLDAREAATAMTSPMTSPTAPTDAALSTTPRRRSPSGIGSCSSCSTRPASGCRS